MERGGELIGTQIHALRSSRATIPTRSEYLQSSTTGRPASRKLRATIPTRSEGGTIGFRTPGMTPKMDPDHHTQGWFFAVRPLFGPPRGPRKIPAIQRKTAKTRFSVGPQRHKTPDSATRHPGQNRTRPPFRTSPDTENGPGPSHTGLVFCRTTPFRTTPRTPKNPCHTA